MAELPVVDGVDVEDLLQRPGGVTAYDELRVHDEVHGAFLAGELGRDGVDEERHVVGDDLDHAVPAGPAVLLHGGGEHVDVGGAGRPGGRGCWWERAAPSRSSGTRASRSSVTTWR